MTIYEITTELLKEIHNRCIKVFNMESDSAIGISQTGTISQLACDRDGKSFKTNIEQLNEIYHKIIKDETNTRYTEYLKLKEEFEPIESDSTSGNRNTALTGSY